MLKKKKSLNSLQQASQEKSLSVYLQQISKTQPLSSKDEAALTVRIRKGDHAALNALVMANLRFVVSVSRGYQNQGVPLTDLINEGNLGLINAAYRFDEKKNFRFISYAVWWIRQAILQVLADQSRIIRLPLNRVGHIHRIGVVQQKLEQNLGRIPSTAEIASEMNVSDDDVQKLMQIGSRHSSLDASFDNKSDMDLHDLIPSVQDENVDDKLSEVSLHKEITKALGILDKREEEIIKMYFGIDYDSAHTLDDIGLRFNLTRERIRQIKAKAMIKLKRQSFSNELQSLLHHS